MQNAELWYAFGILLKTSQSDTFILHYEFCIKKTPPLNNRGDVNRGTTLIRPHGGHLRRSVTGAPVPVLPGNGQKWLAV